MSSSNQIAALLSEKSSSIISQHIIDLTEDGDPISEGGKKGTGETPWWIWLIIAILILALFTCLAIGMYRKKTGYYKKGEKAQQEQDVITDDGLDEPFLTA